MRSRFSILSQLADSRGFAITLLLAAMVLLYFVVVTFDDDPTSLPALEEEAVPANQIVPVKRIEELSSRLTEPFQMSFTSGKHPFFTMHFKAAAPPPPPDTKPPVPPPPVLKKVALLYQGLYTTADGHARAFLKVDGQLKVLPMGKKILEDWAVAQATPQILTLTNPAAEPTVLEFNREKILEIQEPPPPTGKPK